MVCVCVCVVMEKNEPFFRDGGTAQHPCLTAAFSPLSSLAKAGAIRAGGEGRSMATISALFLCSLGPAEMHGYYMLPKLPLLQMGGRKQARIGKALERPGITYKTLLTPAHGASCSLTSLHFWSIQEESPGRFNQPSPSLPTFLVLGRPEERGRVEVGS